MFEEDLADLLAYLESCSPPSSKSRFVLVGHSTGCQQCAHLLRKAAPDSLAATCISGVVLQAPCSDRETDQDNAEFVKLAGEMVAQGDGAEFLPRKANWAPMTASRFTDLYGLVGEGDDYFSSDLSPGQLSERLAGLRALDFSVCAYSLADEYVPASVDKNLMIDRLCEAGGMERLALEGANHNLSKPADGEAIKLLVECVKKNLEALK